AQAASLGPLRDGWGITLRITLLAPALYYSYCFASVLFALTTPVAPLRSVLVIPAIQIVHVTWIIAAAIRFRSVWLGLAGIASGVALFLTFQEIHAGRLPWPQFWAATSYGLLGWALMSGLASSEGSQLRWA